MPRTSKSRTSPDASVNNPEVRTRVVRACQRCRLKKCKCDGATPCTRCKSDDAICTYGKHKKSDKVIFRSGYVQLLERQHAQLIAGLQELYRRTQQGEGWTGPSLELGRNNQPLTHKILEALGVLHPDEWGGTEDMRSVGLGVGCGKRGQENDGCIYSETSSPSTQAALSPSFPTQSAFPQSTVMAKRRSRLPNDSAPSALPAQTLSMPPPMMPNLAPIQPDPYHHTLPTPMATLSDTFGNNDPVTMGPDQAPGLNMAWSRELDELLGNLGGQEQGVKGCQAVREVDWP